MISLGLNQPQLMEPTEEQLRAALAEAVRSRNLLNNKDFQWWIEKLERGADKHYKKLVYKEEEPPKYHWRRGMIQAVESGIHELRLRAERVEEIEQQIKEQHEQRDEPVARGA